MNGIKQTMYLTAEAIYKFLNGLDEGLDTLILCKSSEVNLITTDQSLYEAIGSIQDRSKINMNKLAKLLEVTEIKSFRESMKKPRTILTEDRVEEIRVKAKSNVDNSKVNKKLDNKLNQELDKKLDKKFNKNNDEKS